MKVYISADIEGVAGISDWNEATLSHPEYPRFRDQMQREVRAACEGALAGGATELLVKDAHATGRNLDARELPREAELIHGWTGHPLCMVQELDATFAAVLLIGYHGPAGGGGNPLAHTLSSRKVAGMRLNRRRASEFLLHAHAALLFEVPVVLVTGDQQLIVEVAELNPAIHTVTSKRGVGRAVVTRHPDVVVEEIRAAAQAAVSGDLTACRVKRPKRYRLEVELREPADAYRGSFYPGAELQDERTLAFEHGDFFEVLRMIQFTV
jgi:D-amino peptidase